jgi:hypothetical protein
MSQLPKTICAPQDCKFTYWVIGKKLTIPTRLELSSFNTRIPLNVEDHDLYPEMENDPSERTEPTVMCFTIARCRVSNIWRTMTDTRIIHPDVGKNFKSMDFTEKGIWLKQEKEAVFKKLFSNETSQDPLQRVRRYDSGSKNEEVLF